MSEDTVQPAEPVEPAEPLISMEREGPPDPVPVVPDNNALAIYSNETIAKAYELFVSTEASPHDIAQQLGVPVKKIFFWARRFEWKSRKAELERQVFQAAEAEHRAFLTEHRLPTIRRHLEAATEAEELVLVALRAMKTAAAAGQGMSSIELKRLTEALSAASGVSARAVGLSDQPAPVQDSRQQRQPMILLGVMPLPAGAEKVIDVEES